MTLLHSRPAAEVFEIETSIGRIAGVTGEHPFFDADRHTWILAASLEPGTPLRTVRGRTSVLDVQTRVGPVPVYNLSVTGEENDFAEGILVHNKTGDSGLGAQ